VKLIAILDDANKCKRYKKCDFKSENPIYIYIYIYKEHTLSRNTLNISTLIYVDLRYLFHIFFFFVAYKALSPCCHSQKDFQAGTTRRKSRSELLSHSNHTCNKYYKIVSYK